MLYRIFVEVLFLTIKIKEISSVQGQNIFREIVDLIILKEKRK